MGRELVVGGATKPWEANVTFRALPPDQFATFTEPDYVKIAWTLRADPISATESIFRTETRVITTDPIARAKFRWCWSFLSPGIILIRWAILGPLKREAERRVRERASVGQTSSPLPMPAPPGAHVTRSWRPSSAISMGTCIWKATCCSPAAAQLEQIE